MSARWQRYKAEIIGHFVQGGIAGSLVGLSPLAPNTKVAAAMITVAVLLMWASWNYQYAGFLKKQDTVMRDWRDYMVGFIPIGLLCLAVSLLITWR